MRPYGVSIPDHPDVRDIQLVGAKSCLGDTPGRSGEFRGLCRGPRKARARRYWKHVARAEAKRVVRDMLAA